MSGILPHDLNPKQLEAATAPSGPLLITAGAGSGKTKTLTSRLLHFISNDIPPEEIVSITFTNKAANEMKERASRLLESKGFTDKSPVIGTFHSFAAKILREEAHLLGRTRGFTIFDDDDTEKTIKRILKEKDVDPKKYPPSVLKNRFSKIKSELADPFGFEDQKIGLLFNHYEESVKRQNAFDFDDLIQKLLLLLEENADVRKKYHERYKHFLVDEYQDVNTAQYRLVKLLASKYRDLSVVGDDHQSIYAFRSADFRNFLNFEKDYPDAKIITLDQNYRSTGNIVGASSALISTNKFQRPKKLWTANETGEEIKIVGFYSPDEEAEWVASCLSMDDWASSAILYRTNAQSRVIEQALISAEVPYLIFGGLRFYDRKEIKDLVAALKYAVNPLDESSKDRLLKEFRKTVIRPLIEKIPSMGETLSPLEFLGFFLKETNYLAYLKVDFKNFEDRLENIEELLKYAANFTSLPEFLEKITLLQSTDQPKGSAGPAVKLMTIHMAKGLEFDSVYIVGASEGLIPHERAIFREEDVEEERRLMYVAMTRAKKRLSIGFFGHPSRFLYEIPSEFVSFENFSSHNPDEDSIYLD